LTLLLPDINIVMDGVLVWAYKSVTRQQRGVALWLLHYNSHKSQTAENIVTATGERTWISSIVNQVMEHKLRTSL
jgi:hypothetical protein